MNVPTTIVVAVVLDDFAIGEFWFFAPFEETSSFQIHKNTQRDFHRLAIKMVLLLFS